VCTVPGEQLAQTPPSADPKPAGQATEHTLAPTADTNPAPHATHNREDPEFALPPGHR
jgi:hypothetical protein